MHCTILDCVCASTFKNVCTCEFYYDSRNIDIVQCLGVWWMILANHLNACKIFYCKTISNMCSCTDNGCCRQYTIKAIFLLWLCEIVYYNYGEYHNIYLSLFTNAVTYN